MAGPFPRAYPKSSYRGRSHQNYDLTHCPTLVTHSDTGLVNPESQAPLARWAFYRRDRRSVRHARAYASAALDEWGLSARRDDVLLCVSELATNALLHGVPPGRGFALGLLLHPDGVLRVEVHDSGEGEVRPPDPAPEGEGGRGLLLVSVLADKWGAGPRNPGKIVWAEFGTGGPRGGR
ncbi:hypothetical protein GCM10010259_32150 [Streptomyces daghestanicus]|uniref:Histidine kinase/HSP90-like ATPase domain-containing protein n=1 Tax=Streptomyces daghestanicus TaxID=66885 RepID=A0ABQ3Q0J8_9ACTN|nr:hypothetical protein GCM10010259_32150 [Streptomyces daghestanicus]GHI30774.1 hypothetical protein Sdagh_25040 [Streptomyces daghestanicus]